MNDYRYRISVFILAGVLLLSYIPIIITTAKGEPPIPACIGIASAALGALLTLIQGPQEPRSPDRP